MNLSFAQYMNIGIKRALVFFHVDNAGTIYKIAVGCFPTRETTIRQGDSVPICNVIVHVVVTYESTHYIAGFLHCGKHTGIDLWRALFLVFHTYRLHLFVCKGRCILR